MNERLIHTTIGTAIKPTIFEILAKQSFQNLVHSISKQLVKGNSSRFEEWFLCINFVLEYFYLKYQDASFSESFYGLRRVVRKNGKLEALKSRDKVKALIFLTLVPYFKRKLDDYYAKVNENTNKNDRLFCKVHKTINISLKTVSLFLLIRYLMSDCVRPSTVSTSLISQQFHYKNNRIYSSPVIGVLFKMLEVVMFFVQFFDCWQSANMSSQLKHFPQIEPPKKLKMANRLHNICPICGKPWVAATVVPVSGFVYCFTCILNHLMEYKKCPVTGWAASEDHLIRLC